MDAPPGLPVRLRRLVREAGRFGTVGAVGLVVNVLVFNLCRQGVGLGAVRSGVLATACAICATYLGNRYWTYAHADKTRRRREAGLFLMFSGAGMVLENGVLAISHHGLGLTSATADNIAKNVIGLGLASLFRFWAYRTWVFRGARTRSLTGARTGAVATGGPVGPVRPEPEGRGPGRSGAVAGPPSISASGTPGPPGDSLRPGPPPG
ncbi:GtrA family protein [Streptomyces alkaliphilus]|uniref:GtrA family protein n=1 Tax=Streptomyces alkaliphilus TaxID=1472722 RepID=A0A7W3TG91_9ACTN|nr:GtrA family protein [Streptomyces alkaliphilus]MBB0246110.1 GtrA family protein [Streptomyces alkaliphilus]